MFSNMNKVRIYTPVKSLTLTNFKENINFKIVFIFIKNSEATYTLQAPFLPRRYLTGPRKEMQLFHNSCP